MSVLLTTLYILYRLRSMVASFTTAMGLLRVVIPNYLLTVWVYGNYLL